MKISEHWLRNFVHTDLTTRQLAEQLTLAGLEVDAVEPVCGEFSGVVVAQVEDIQPHPYADKLKVCQVNSGEAILQIVCGAPNVFAGMKAPLATIGARLPGNVAIQRSRLRGVSSQGMLCSAQELGMAEQAEGLLVLPDNCQVGEDIHQALALHDHSLEIDLTPDRGDCLSAMGLARELAALNGLVFTPPQPVHVDVVTEVYKRVHLHDPEAASRYACRVIQQVDAAAPSPLWLTEKLRRCGIRPVSVIVDITNFMMLKYGQPLHAFDAETINGDIQVRKARDNETLRLLDGSVITLDTETLVIADEQMPLAIAGVMGGADSAVGAYTQDIVLESAWFSPVAIAGKARQYGLHTDSSHRFERGVDPALCQRALEEATALILQLAGGKPGPLVCQEDTRYLPGKTVIEVSRQRVNALLGFALDEDFITRSLADLGLEVQQKAPDQWLVIPPSYRFDLAIEADIIEELARMVGYGRIPEAMPDLQVQPVAVPEGDLTPDAVREHWVACGYHEAITYSFIDEELARQFSEHPGYRLANPISAEMTVMRQSLLPGLLESMKTNLARQQSRVRLFELGRCFLPDAADSYQEKTFVAGVACGSLMPPCWGHTLQPADFYSVKGEVEELLNRCEAISFAPCQDRPYLHPGRAARVMRGDQVIGVIGQLHPLLVKSLGIKAGAPVVFELDYESIRHQNIPDFTPVSKYPAISRDIAVLVDQSVSGGEIIELAKQAVSDLHHEIRIFDVYKGKNLPENKKSVALNLLLQHDSKTLIEEDISQAVQAVTDRLASELGAALRE